MSEEWSHYVARMGGHSASIVFDDGISETIKSLPENMSILVTADLVEFNDFNMPTDHEAERLEILQNALDVVVEGVGGYSVGRVTSNKKRHHFYYASEMSDEIAQALYSAAEVTGHQLNIGRRNDPDKDAYFDDLYPDPESRQVVNDMNLIRLLVEKGDDLHVARRIDHLSIFKSKHAATAYSEWAMTEGYDVDPIRKEGPLFAKTYNVETHNETAVTVYAINPHSLGHHRKAVELGGTYDGWGTTVVPKT